MSDSITIRRFDDMHVHFRRDWRLREVAPRTVQYASRAIVMPNTKSPIVTGGDVCAYKDEIRRVLQRVAHGQEFTPLMTIKILDSTTPEMIVNARKAGAIAGKVYPAHVTSNSEDGLKDFFSNKIQDTFRAMRDMNMPLLIHGEINRERLLVTDRETAFLPIFEQLIARLPRMRMVLEHISTRNAVEFVQQQGEYIAATITAHHLCLTLNDVIGSGTQPHNCCMPTAKSFDDRDALLEAATSGNPKFFFGSDSAPWERRDKECSHGKCGVYSAPIVPQLLAQIFAGIHRLDRLENFTSGFGADFYGLPRNTGTITLSKGPEWFVPEVRDRFNQLVIFMAGKPLSWRLA